MDLLCKEQDLQAFSHNDTVAINNNPGFTICELNKNMKYECPIDESDENCNNNSIGKYKWKKVVLGKSDIDNIGLFPDELIRAGGLIIEYLGHEIHEKDFGKHKFFCRKCAPRPGILGKTHVFGLLDGFVVVGLLVVCRVRFG